MESAPLAVRFVRLGLDALVSSCLPVAVQHGRRAELGEPIRSSSQDELAPVLTTPQVYGNEFTGRGMSTPRLNSSDDKCCSHSTD